MSASRRKYEMRERAKAYQATRQRIMRATFELHDAKGVAATKFSDIAAHAGLAPATVTRHFPTMGDLVSACGAHVWQWLALPDAKEVFRGVDALAERLRRLVQETCGIYARGEAPILGARNDRNAVPQLDLFLRQLDTALEQLVREALSPYDPSERVIQLALTVLDYGVWRALRERGLDEVAEFETLLEFVVERGPRDRWGGAHTVSQARTGTDGRTSAATGSRSSPP